MSADLQLAQLSVHEPVTEPEPEPELAAEDQGITAVAQYDYEVRVPMIFAILASADTHPSLRRPQKTTSCPSSRASSLCRSYRKMRTGGLGGAQTERVVGFSPRRTSRLSTPPRHLRNPNQNPSLSPNLNRLRRLLRLHHHHQPPPRRLFPPSLRKHPKQWTKGSSRLRCMST